MTVSSRPTALITGASSGIGRATALGLAAAGFDLLLVARSLDKLQRVAAAAEQQGAAVHILSLDLLNLEIIQSKLQAWVANQAVDVLINNAGIGYTGALADMPLADWKQVMDLNVISVFQCIQAVLPQMRSRAHGKIINVASIAAHNAFPNWGAYCASKAALVTLSKVLSAEESSNGIRVSIVSPGSVNTEIWDTETVNADFDRSQMMKPEMIAQAILNVIQMPDGAVVEEVIVMPSGGAF